MAKECAGCSSLTAVSANQPVPAFLEPVLWPTEFTRMENGQCYVCLACGQSWVDGATPVFGRFVPLLSLAEHKRTIRPTPPVRQHVFENNKTAARQSVGRRRGRQAASF